MNKKYNFYLVLLFFFFSKLTLYAYSSNPKDFINELVNDAITTLQIKT